MPPPNSTRSSSLPLTAAPMSNPSPSPFPSPPPNPIAAASSFLHHHLSRLASCFAAPRPTLAAVHPPRPQGASLSLAAAHPLGTQGPSLSLRHAPDEVGLALTGAPIFTICNSSNEFVLVFDPATGIRSLALLSHVRTRQPVLGKGAKVVPITLDQVALTRYVL